MKLTRNEFLDAMTAQFIYAEKPASAMYDALATNKNLILYGPGGHGKSDMAEAAIKLAMDPDKFYEEVYIASCSQQMDATPFVGYLNVPEFKLGRRVQVLTDTVFLSKQYAILEEGFDAPDDLLLSLKDGLQRGYICVNGKCEKNKLQTLVICTNIDPTAWAGSENTRKALLGRFVFRLEVSWPSYTSKDYEKMFALRGKSDLVVAEMAQICVDNKFPLSPRDAMNMHAVYNAQGFEALNSFMGMPEPVFQKLKDFQAKIPYIKEVETLESTLLATIELAPQQRQSKIIQIDGMITKLSKIPKDGLLSGRVRSCFKMFDDLKMDTLRGINAPAPAASGSLANRL